MAIKDDLNEIKNEIGAQEQFLESVIKGERFFKKYKKLIIAVFVAILIGVAGFYASKIIEQNRIDTANTAYSKLITNPHDTDALNTLKDKAPSLYALHQFKIAMQTGNTSEAKELLNLPIDPLLKQILSAQIGEQNSVILSDYAALMRGYELLKQNKIDEAKVEFAKISLDSQLINLVKNLQHYQGNK